MKILLIDDDTRYRDSLTPYLESWGFEVLEAKTASEGQNLVSKVKFSLLLIDGTLPDTNGIDLIQKIRDDGNMVPIVFVSALWKDQNTVDRLIGQLQVSLVKSKPIVPAELCKEIVALVGNPSQQLPSMDSTASDDKKLTPEEKLEAVRQAYIQELPALVREIRSKIQIAWQFPNSEVDLTELIRHVHNLRGTAGMHGHLQLGILMDRVESFLKSVEAGKESLTGDAWKSIEAALERAEKELV